MILFIYILDHDTHILSVLPCLMYDQVTNNFLIKHCCPLDKWMLLKRDEGVSK